MFDKLTIRAKLLATFGALCTLMVFVAVLAVHSLSEANAHFVHFVEGINARAIVAAHVRVAVDRRAIAARNLVLVSSPADVETEKAAVLKAHQEVQANLDKLKAMIATAPDSSEKARSLIAELATIEQSYGPVALDIVNLALSGNREKAIKKMNEECRPLLATLAKTSSEYGEYTETRARQLIEDSASQYAKQRAALMLVCVLAIAAAAVFGWLITRALHASLGEDPAALGESAQRVANGDLTPMPGVEQAPRGSVLASLATMQASLSRVVSQVREASDSIATGSSQIALGSADLSQRTEEQASALQQTSGTMEELRSTVANNADSAQRANCLAVSASTVAKKGGAVVSQVIETMQGISASSHKISDIIAVIDSIAFQTNILALNAAVEAARAGDQGRGFAVVAGEVRALAQRSAGAAKEIKTLITTSVEQVGLGAALVESAGNTMEEILQSIKEVSDIVAQISLASAEQSNGVAQVGQAVTQIDTATQQNAALVEQSAAAAASLKQQAQWLVELMSAFRLA
jgi:methyl-accepting chemotaxis protein-1 (serine sensor receptor)